MLELHAGEGGPRVGEQIQHLVQGARYFLRREGVVNHQVAVALEVSHRGVAGCGEPGDPVGFPVEAVEIRGIGRSGVVNPQSVRCWLHHGTC